MNTSYSWENHSLGLVDEANWVQTGDTCWAYGLTRQMNAICRIANLLGRTETLSVAHFVLFLSRAWPDSLTDTLALRGLDRPWYFLRISGMVRLDDFLRYYDQAGIPIRPTVVRVPRFVVSNYVVHRWERYQSYGEFESAFFTTLDYSPVAASVPSYPSLEIFRSEGIFANRIYCPTIEERAGLDPPRHVMCATGRGTFNGIPYVQFRDSAIGDIIKVELGVRILIRFVEMSGPRVLV